jgi:membrane protein
MIFKVLPDVEIRWLNVWGGAVITAVLFAVGKFAIGKYLGYSSIGSAYGAAGSLVVLLVWVYYSSLVVFMGAEITQVISQKRGEHNPEQFAVAGNPEKGAVNSAISSADM